MSLTPRRVCTFLKKNSSLLFCGGWCVRLESSPRTISNVLEASYAVGNDEHRQNTKKCQVSSVVFTGFGGV
ncbi:unnamed protein product [Allacma fusca]|uniref:Uncharacterized protein n=1 Tax=Allacma fusca TaxID=39272 RepID=A0A8J2K754_9HEXA|nr:unnamed protein product [Allacma fusca]